MGSKWDDDDDDSLTLSPFLSLLYVGKRKSYVIHTADCWWYGSFKGHVKRCLYRMYYKTMVSRNIVYYWEQCQS